MTRQYALAILAQWSRVQCSLHVDAEGNIIQCPGHWVREDTS